MTLACILGFPVLIVNEDAESEKLKRLIRLSKNSPVKSAMQLVSSRLEFLR